MRCSRIGRVSRLLKEREGGFTLVEVMIAGALLIVISAAALVILESSFRTQAGQQRRAESLDDGRLALHTVTKDIRQAISIDLAESDRGHLDMQTLFEGDERRVVYDLDGETLRRKIEDGAWVPMVEGVVGADVFCYDPPSCDLAAPTSATPPVIRVTLLVRADTRGAEPVMFSTDVRLRNTG